MFDLFYVDIYTCGKAWKGLASTLRELKNVSGSNGCECSKTLEGIVA